LLPRVMKPKELKRASVGHLDALGLGVDGNVVDGHRLRGARVGTRHELRYGRVHAAALARVAVDGGTATEVREGHVIRAEERADLTFRAASVKGVGVQRGAALLHPSDLAMDTAWPRHLAALPAAAQLAALGDGLARGTLRKFPRITRDPFPGTRVVRARPRRGARAGAGGPIAASVLRDHGALLTPT
jgi:hypothetical protein